MTRPKKVYRLIDKSSDRFTGVILFSFSENILGNGEEFLFAEFNKKSK